MPTTPDTATTTHIDPDIAGARGAFACAVATLASVQAAREQMERLAATAASPRGLGNAPVVAEIWAFVAEIRDTETTLHDLLIEHLDHAEVQDFLARDEQLREAADGYLDARERR